MTTLPSPLPYHHIIVVMVGLSVIESNYSAGYVRRKRSS